MMVHFFMLEPACPQAGLIPCTGVRAPRLHWRDWAILHRQAGALT